MAGVLQLLFGSTDVTTLLIAGKVSMQKSINQRWTLNMTLYDATASNRPAAGQPFTLKEDGTTIFTGFIDQVQEYALQGESPANASAKLYYQCSCSSWASICDHRVVVATYPLGRDAATVIADIVTNFLDGEGITTSGVSALLPFIQQPLVFDGVSVAAAFDQIRDLTGGQWWIDENKVLWFQLVGTGTIAGFTVSGNDEWLSGTMKVTATTKDFRNVQYVRAGAGLTTVSKTESSTVTSANGWWVITTFAITSAPTVKVNGVPQNVYQLGVDAYGQNGWYWGMGDNGVQQGQQIAPAVGSVVQVTYDAASSNVTSEQNAASIAARAAIEGTSGKWENVIEAQDIQSLTLAQQLAQGLLARSSAIPTVITLQTYRNNYVIGNQVQVTVPMHSLNAKYTVMQIAAQHQSKMQSPTFGTSFLYTITLSDAQDIGNFVKWFEGLYGSIKAVAAATGNAPTIIPIQPSPSQGTPTQGAWFAEKPSGTYDGVNTLFTLSYTPNPQFVIWIFVNGVFQHPPSVDYSLSGNAITFTVAPKSTDNVWTIYLRAAPGSGGNGATGGGTQARQFGSPSGSTPASGGYASATGTFNLPNSSSKASIGLTTDGTTVTVGSVTYTFRNTPSVANDVSAVTVSGFVPAQCLANAINGGYGAGTLYGAGTTPNPDASASYSSTIGLTINAQVSPSVNPINLSSSSGSNTFSPASISPGNMTAGDTITVGAKTYTFVAALNNAVANEILIQAPAAFPNTTVQDMLADAINNGPAGSGVWYSSATTANADIQAVADDVNNKIVVTALTPGSAGNSLAVSSAASTRFSWSGSTLTGGSGGGTGASNDRLDWGNAVRYSILSDVTIAFWVKIPSNSVALGSILQFTDGSASGDTGWTNYAVHVNGSSGAWSIHYGHQYAGFSEETHDFSTNIPNDTWKFVALVRDATGKTVTCYTGDVGGSSVSNAGTFTYVNVPSGGSAASLVLGFALGHGDTFNLVGTIEEHYVYNRQLTTDELAAVMQRNAPLNGMVLGSLMGDTPEKDISGNGGSGAVTGTTLVQGHS